MIPPRISTTRQHARGHRVASPVGLLAHRHGRARPIFFGVSMQLRPYQAAHVEALRESIRRGHRRIIAVAPTGSGKGSVLATMAQTCVSRGRPCVVMTPRRELVEDLSVRISSLGVEHGVILAGDRRVRPDLLCQVASVQTLARRTKPPADLVIVDECHHATSESWAKILAAYPDASVIGFTATPCRLSGKGLGTVFDDLVMGPQPAELTDLGFLVPVTGFAFDAPDLRGVKKTAGDFNEGELGVVMGGTKLVGNIVEQWKQHSTGVRTIVFAVNVEHSKKLVAEFQAAGIPAEHVDGTADSATRSEIFARFRSGQTPVLCNVMLATEGFDLPEIGCVVLARPTMSLALALQMIGRGRRPLRCTCGLIPHWRSESCECGRPVEKRVLRLHDHAGVVMLHGLPDDARDWSLAHGAGASKKGSVSVRTCEKCFALYDPKKNDSCPRCGHANKVKKSSLKQIEGEAISLDEAAKRRVEPRGRMFDAYRELVEKGRAKGWKKNAAAMMFKARFGFFPWRSWTEALAAETVAAPTASAPAAHSSSSTCEASHG